jgi:acyl-CoA thioester hydrolase
MYTYEHKVKYYETDKMGITHHSNYIRFMEEARVEWMNSIGWSYKKCEELGIGSPVISVNCEYKHNTTFDDIVEIRVALKKYNGLRLTIGYEMLKEGKTVAIGETEHCFLNSEGKPVRLKKDYPQFDEILNKELAKSL